MPSETLTLYHMPNTRSSGALTLLHELGIPFDLKVMNLKAGENRQPDYLALNPLGKVPAIRHGDTLITEQVAIFIYLADRFASGRLAPALDDPQRGTYLRWLVFYAAAFEPALMDKAFNHSVPGTQATYGTYDQMLATLEGALTPGPYLLGDRFSAADILWGGALTWTTMFKLVPETPIISAYVARHGAREATQRVRAQDADWAAAHAAAVAS